MTKAIDWMTAKDAIAAAKLKLLEHYENPIDLRVEEIDGNNRKYWFVTLGFLVERKTTLEAVLGKLPPAYERVYKLFHVNKVTHVVERMLIREPS